MAIPLSTTTLLRNPPPRTSTKNRSRKPNSNIQKDYRGDLAKTLSAGLWTCVELELLEVLCGSSHKVYHMVSSYQLDVSSDQTDLGPELTHVTQDLADRRSGLVLGRYHARVIAE